MQGPYLILLIFVPSFLSINVTEIPYDRLRGSFTTHSCRVAPQLSQALGGCVQKAHAVWGWPYLLLAIVRKVDGVRDVHIYTIRLLILPLDGTLVVVLKLAVDGALVVILMLAVVVAHDVVLEHRLLRLWSYGFRNVGEYIYFTASEMTRILSDRAQTKSLIFSSTWHKVGHAQYHHIHEHLCLGVGIMETSDN